MMAVDPLVPPHHGILPFADSSMQRSIYLTMLASCAAVLDSRPLLSSYHGSASKIPLLGCEEKSYRKTRNFFSLI
jgi:hypothetical protein